MSWKPILLWALGAAVAITGILHANGLLASKALTGTEFVWLTGAYLATGFLITILPNVTELSLASLTVKIAEAKKAAEVTLKQLNEALELSFGPAIASVKDAPRHETPGPYDDRFDKFFVLASAIEKAGLRTRFAPELDAAARIIAVGQLRRVGNLNHAVMEIAARSEVLPTPTAVSIELRKSGIAQDIHVWYFPDVMSLDDAHEEAEKAVKAYAKIYEYTL